MASDERYPRITVRIPEGLPPVFEDLVDAGLYQSKSAAYRDALRQFARAHPEADIEDVELTLTGDRTSDTTSGFATDVREAGAGDPITDGGDVLACPECDSSNVDATSTHPERSQTDYDRACRACGHTWERDQDVHRERRHPGPGGPTRGIAKDLAQTDPDDVLPDGGVASEHVCPNCGTPLAREPDGWACHNCNQRFDLDELGEPRIRTDGGQSLVPPPGPWQDPDPDPHPIKDICVDCGEEAWNHRCGCCGWGLCGRHHEVGGGFCSDFTRVTGTIPACVREDDLIVGTHLARRNREMGGDVPSVVLTPGESDTFHLPGPDNEDAPTEYVRDSTVCDAEEPVVVIALDEVDASNLCEDCIERYLEDVRQYCDDCERGFDTVDDLEEHYCWAQAEEEDVATDGGDDECPVCGEDPGTIYRCENCGADLAKRDTTSSRSNAGDPM